MKRLLLDRLPLILAGLLLMASAGGCSSSRNKSQSDSYSRDSQDMGYARPDPDGGYVSEYPDFRGRRSANGSLNGNGSPNGNGQGGPQLPPNGHSAPVLRPVPEQDAPPAIPESEYDGNDTTRRSRRQAFKEKIASLWNRPHADAMRSFVGKAAKIC